MKTTLDLLEAARLKYPDLSERQLSVMLGHSPQAVRSGKVRGNLSPVLAGQLAELLGEPVTRWMAIAAIEGAAAITPPETLQKLRRTIV